VWLIYKRNLKELKRTKTITLSLITVDTYTNPIKLKKTEQDGDPQQDEPHNVHQKQSLSRNRCRSPIPHFTEPQFRNLHAGARCLSATAPVRDAIRAAHRVGAEALSGARRRRRLAAQSLRWQPENSGFLEIRCRNG